MRNDNQTPRGHRLRWAALTALVLVGTILLNVAFSVVCDRNRWFADNTVTELVALPHTMYTLTDDVRQIIKERGEPAMAQINRERAERGENPIKTDIIFCADRDRLEGNELMRYILYTALALEKEFDWIEVSYLNVEKNPSSANAYKATSATNIYPSDVIISCGSEYRVQTSTGFFTYSSAVDTEPWNYTGEKTFASAILDVTCAEAPIACWTTQHGEPSMKDCAALVAVIEGAGYRVQEINLMEDEIPADCRLIVTYDPQRDFYGYGEVPQGEDTEIDKLDEFLDGAFSYMLFVDANTPKLPNLEEYLQEWGVTVCRATDASGMDQNYHIRDTVERMDANGYVPVGSYATGGGIGAAITKSLRESDYPARVVFPNATALKMPSAYALTHQEADEATGQSEMEYGSYYRNGVMRTLLDVFVGGENAVAEIDGKTYEVTTKENAFKLMTITSESRTVQESNYSQYNDASYVMVCASTEFASNAALTSEAYGNADVLLSALRSVSGEKLPITRDLFKYMDDATVSNEAYLPSSPTALLVCFAVIPVVMIAAIGIWVTVRRRHR